MLVYGGRGALGSACVYHFKLAKWWVANVDMHPNDRADFNITVPEDAPWVQQEEHVVNSLDTVLHGQKLEAIICAAGGWTGGNAVQDLGKQVDLMWRQSVWSSTIAATIACKYLSEGGVLALCGAKSALDGTPRMMGYGMAKAAVHQLVKSLGEKDSGMPKNSLAVAILPVLLDTALNRKWMPNSDRSQWTPLSYVVELIEKWIEDEYEERPPNGSLVELVTKNYLTEASVYVSEVEREQTSRER